MTKITYDPQDIMMMMCSSGKLPDGRTINMGHPCGVEQVTISVTLTGSPGHVKIDITELMHKAIAELEKHKPA